MKRILATTALVALTTVPAFAQTNMTTSTDDTMMSQNDTMGGMFDMNGMQLSADEMIGRSVYASSVDGAGTGDAVITGGGTAADGMMTADGTAGMDAPADDWENIGSVNDVIFSTDGNIEAVVLDIGGFLGIGAREISLTMDELTLINDTSSDEEFFVVYNGAPAGLEQRPEMDRDSMTQQGRTFQTTGGDTVVTDDAAMQTDNTVVTDNSYLTDEDRAALTADDLIDADVHDMNGEDIGNIEDIVLTADGQVGNVIVDVGGFLGIGARSVALAFDDLQIARDEGGMTSSLSVWVDLTEEELETMPIWTGDN